MPPPPPPPPPKKALTRYQVLLRDRGVGGQQRGGASAEATDIQTDTHTAAETHGPASLGNKTLYCAGRIAVLPTTSMKFRPSTAENLGKWGKYSDNQKGRKYYEFLSRSNF